MDVRVEAPPPDDVAAGRRNRDAAEAREERPGEEERGADLARELGVEIGLPHAAGIDSNVVRRRPLDVGAEIGEKLDHRLDVADARDVREPYLL